MQYWKSELIVMQNRCKEIANGLRGASMEAFLAIEHADNVLAYAAYMVGKWAELADVRLKPNDCGNRCCRD